jgi:hypothetical protein
VVRAHVGEPRYMKLIKIDRFVREYREKNNFVGRKSTSDDVVAIKRIEEAFAPAFEHPADRIVWLESTQEFQKWQNRK